MIRPGVLKYIRGCSAVELQAAIGLIKGGQVWIGALKFISPYSGAEIAADEARYGKMISILPELQAALERALSGRGLAPAAVLAEWLALGKEDDVYRNLPEAHAALERAFGPDLAALRHGDK
jgi:hypothetical protein